MNLKTTLAMGSLLGLPVAAQAAELKLSVEIPKMNVAEYHRPYVAIWIEGADQKVAGNLAVWYDVKLKNDEGTKWLKDMRQWWRKSGRDLAMPADGLSSPTRAPGQQRVSFDGSHPVLAKLAPGAYQLNIEAAREVGGRELLKIPFQWPPTAASTASAQGKHELGAVSLETRP